MSDETWVVTLPKLGESVTEGVIGAFFKNVGDEVEFDDPLFEVSTDKVDTEVPSSYDGVVLEVMAQEGDTVSVGAAIMRIGGKGATVPNRLPSAAHGVAAAGGRSLNDPSARSADRKVRRPRTPTSRRQQWVRFSRLRCRNWANR
jgi:2-oxoglutarate dehydrogenase E2 component (dihydrolipoamide succinyltransferase)